MPSTTLPSVDLVAALRAALLVVHLLGLVAGLGAATMLDAIFVRLLLARRVSQDHWQIVNVLCATVTIGLALLWLSGLGFLAEYAAFAPAKLGNEKIWAKILIVAILTLNGVFIHAYILPLIRARVGRGLFDDLSDLHTSVLLASGVVSAVSWYVPFFLGAVAQLNAVPAVVILAVYAALLFVGLVAALVVQKRVLSRGRSLAVEKLFADGARAPAG